MEGLLKRPNLEPTKEDAALHRQFVLNGMRIIHGPEMRDQVLERLSQGEPIEAVASVAMMALEKLETSAEEQGKPLDDLTKLMAGNELIGEIISTGEEAGSFKKLTEEERAMALNQVISQVLDRDIQSGKINPQELLKAGQEAQQRMRLNMQNNEVA